jgi:hypothetical protein
VDVSKPLRAKRGPAEHKYLPKVTTGATTAATAGNVQFYITPACTCGWSGETNYRTNAKDAWEDHRREHRPA